jgi:hypothetical protein
MTFFLLNKTQNIQAIHDVASFAGVLSVGLYTLRTPAKEAIHDGV